MMRGSEGEGHVSCYGFDPVLAHAVALRARGADYVSQEARVLVDVVLERLPDFGPCAP